MYRKKKKKHVKLFQLRFDIVYCKCTPYKYNAQY